MNLFWESFGVLDEWSLLMGGGPTWRFDCNPKMMDYWEKEQIFRRRINPSYKTPRWMKLSMTLN